MYNNWKGDESEMGSFEEWKRDTMRIHIIQDNDYNSFFD